MPSGTAATEVGTEIAHMATVIAVRAIKPLRWICFLMVTVSPMPLICRAPCADKARQLAGPIEIATFWKLFHHRGDLYIARLGDSTTRGLATIR
jgi:hypothetical protein